MITAISVIIKQRASSAFSDLFSNCTRVLTKKVRMSDSSKAVCLKDVEEAAHKILPKKALDYYKSGAEQQSTLRDNSRAFQRYISGASKIA